MHPADLVCLQADRWFAAIAPERQQRLILRARVRRLADGGRLCAIGDPPDGLYAVLDGDVRLVAATAAGHESLALMMGPGAWFGGLSAVDGGPRTHEAVAVGPARVLHLTQPDLDRATAEDPLIWRDLALLIAAYHRAANAVLAQSLTQPLKVRLARSLAAAARARPDAAIRLRQEDLAAMHGVSRQTINKALKGLEGAGLVSVAYGQVAVLDAPRLRALGR